MSRIDTSEMKPVYLTGLCFAAFIYLVICERDVKSQDRTLDFALSPATDKHIALQERDDHYRVHFLARAKGLKATPCRAIVVCTTDDKIGPSSGEFHRDVVMFNPDKEDQTFSVFLRAPRLKSQDVTYYVWLEVFEHFPRNLYRWRIAIDDNGMASIQKPDKGEYEIVENRALWEQHEEDTNGITQTRFRIVFETRVIAMTVSEEFRFGVDQIHSDKEVFDVITRLN